MMAIGICLVKAAVHNGRLVINSKDVWFLKVYFVLKYIKKIYINLLKLSKNTKKINWNILLKHLKTKITDSPKGMDAKI